MVKNNVYTNIKLKDETYEVKVINGELYIPLFMVLDGVGQVYYLKVSSSIIKQLTCNTKVRRTSRRNY